MWSTACSSSIFTAQLRIPLTVGQPGKFLQYYPVYGMCLGHPVSLNCVNIINSKLDELSTLGNCRTSLKCLHLVLEAAESLLLWWLYQNILSKSKSKKTLFNVGQCKQYNISFHLKWVLVAWTKVAAIWCSWKIRSVCSGKSNAHAVMYCIICQ